MKHATYLLTALGVVLLIFGAAPVSAQYMMGSGPYAESSASNTAANTTSSEQQGQNIYNQLQNKQITCSKLNDTDFANLGDFYMSEMMGSAHDAMDQYMTRQLGASGDRQVHIAMGERLSGCNTNASYPSSAYNYAPLAWMGGMMSNDTGNNWGWNTMGRYNNSSWTGADTALIALLVLAVMAGLFVWLRTRSQPNTTTTSPLELLKERYAKGEIDQKEFDEKRKDLK